MQQPFRRLLHRAQRREPARRIPLDELLGAPARRRRNVDVVAQQMQERLVAHESLRLIHRVAVAFGRILRHEVQALTEVRELLGRPHRPVFTLERCERLLGHPPEILGVHLLIARLHHQADLLAPCPDRFLADDLDDRLGQPVGVHQREHLLLHGAARGILPRPPPRTRDHRFSDGPSCRAGCLVCTGHAGNPLPSERGARATRFFRDVSMRPKRVARAPRSDRHDHADGSSPCSASHLWIIGSIAARNDPFA